MSTCHKSQFSRLIDCLKNEKDELEFGFLRVQYHSNHFIPFSLFREQPFKMLRVFFDLVGGSSCSVQFLGAYPQRAAEEDCFS